MNNNGYSSNLVDKLIRRHSIRQLLKNCTTFDTSKEVTKFILLLYASGFTCGLQYILKSVGMIVVYSSSNKLENVLDNPTDERLTYDKSEI